jgi:16S rRNA C1402 N4-methylase RsmH
MTTGGTSTILEHIPVMISEVMSHLITNPSGIYIDGTIGLGGHSKTILSSLNKDGHLIGIDRDDRALSVAEKNLARVSTNFSLYNRSYTDADIIIKELMPEEAREGDKKPEEKKEEAAPAEEEKK